MRSVQPHSPCGVKVILAWISTQYVPAAEDRRDGQVYREGGADYRDWLVVALKICVPGRPPLSV